MHPVFDGDLGRVSEAHYERDVFADRGPSCDSGLICSVINEETVGVLVAKEIVLRHIFRVMTGDLGDLIAPNKCRQAFFHTPRVDRVKRTALKGGGGIGQFRSIWLDRLRRPGTGLKSGGN